MKYPAFQIADEDEMEVEVPADAEIVILSDVHLDSPKVLQSLRKMFQGK